MDTVGIISILSGVVSIGLAIYTIVFSNKEAEKSSNNYEQTKELLHQIERKEDLIDRSIQFEQRYMFSIINKLLDGQGGSPVDLKPLTIAEIEEIVEGKTVEAQKKIKALEESIEKMPRIYYGSTEPENAKDGDLWLKP